MPDLDVEKTKTCFMAMPITTRPDQADLYRDRSHWRHVMENLFEPALRDAGYEPIRPSARGSQLIHARIIDQLVKADLVLADLSSLNANVLYELGVRTSLNKPLALVADEHTMSDLPFDTNSINTHAYDSGLKVWELQDQIERLRAHIEETEFPGNPMWRHFGVELTAEGPAVSDDPKEAKLQLLTERMERVLEQAEHAERAGQVETVRLAAANIALQAASGGSPTGAVPELSDWIASQRTGATADSGHDAPTSRWLKKFSSSMMGLFPEIERAVIPQPYDEDGPKLILGIRDDASVKRSSEIRSVVMKQAREVGLGERVTVRRHRLDE